MLRIELFGEESERFTDGGVIGDHSQRIRSLESTTRADRTQSRTAFDAIRTGLQILLNILTIAALIGLLRK